MRTRPAPQTHSAHDMRAPASWPSRMLAHLLALIVLAPVALATTSLSGVAYAAQRSAAGPAQEVTIIVLDMSGSMGGNDPDGLRCSAADAFISLSGPNQFIGVVGMVDPNGSGQAQKWADPVEMQTLPARQQLIQTIATKSNHCAARGDTPTFDALSKAYDMLVTATKGGRAGSVILLTDGVPAPNESQQKSDILQQLVPKFSQAGFPINTIQLDNQADTREFLHDVSSGTNGSFDGDVNPATNKPDPLEITPILLRYFAASTGRTPHEFVGASTGQNTLSGRVTSRDFQVSSLVQHLDVIVVKQDRSASVALKAADGTVYTATSSSGFVAQDPHYAIFSIDNPTPGDWVANITGGSGQFVIYGLVETNLQIALTQPADKRQTFPIDQPLAIQAQLTSVAADVNGNYTVRGELTDGHNVVQTVILDHQPGSALYTKSIKLPTNYKPGTYDLTLYVYQGGGAPLTASTPRVINFELFPTPYLVDGGGKPVGAVATTATAFDGALQRIYSLPVVSWFSGLPLNNIPATPSAMVSGVVTLDGKVYSNSTVHGSAKPASQACDSSGSSSAGQTGGSAEAATAAQVTPTSPGHFETIFPVAADGAYNLCLSASGTFKDSHGAFGAPTQRQVTLTIQPATGSQEARAWIVTAIYALILIFLAPFIYRWPLLLRRRGSWTLKGRTRAESESGSFRRMLGRRRYLRNWFRPNAVSSNEVWGFPGLLLVWGSFGRSAIRPDGRGSGDWTPHRRNSVYGSLKYEAGQGNTITIDIAQEGRHRRSGFDTEAPRRGAGASRGFGQGSRQTQSRATATPAGARGRSNNTNTRPTNTSRPTTRGAARGSSRPSGGFGRPR